MIQAQTSASEALRIMIFKEIELFNIRQFDRNRFELRYGINLITLGHLQGKSTLIQSIRSALSTSSIDSLGILKDGTSESKIVMKFEMDSKNFTAVKQWTGGILMQHTVGAEGNDLHFDLCDSAQCLQWAHLFLGIYDKQPVTDAPGEPANVAVNQYQFFLSMIFPGIEIRDLAEKAWQHDFFNMSCYDKIDQGVLQLQLTASSQLTELKMMRQTADSEQKKFLKFEQELNKIDPEIALIETTISQLSSHAESDESELRQAEKINDFILTKKNEIEKIDFELRSYGSLLKNNIAGEFSDDEIREIDKKRLVYEQILKREEALNHKLIERGHLEKNLKGILNEISQFQITLDRAEGSSGLGRIDAFKTEVARIKGALKALEGIESELDSLKKEKFLYQSSYDKFHVINKLKQVISQNEQKKIRSTVEKLEQERNRLNEELEQMRSSVHEDRYRSVFGKVQQKRQQILEYRKRLEELYTGRLEILKDYEGVRQELEDLPALEGNIRKRIYQKKYISMAGEVSRFIRNELLRVRRSEFERHWDALSGSVPESYIQLAVLLLSEDGSSHNLAGDERYTYSEIAEFMQMFRLICLDYRSKLRTVILDEHVRTMLDESQNRRIEDLVEFLKFKQALAFEKI